MKDGIRLQGFILNYFILLNILTYAAPDRFPLSECGTDNSGEQIGRGFETKIGRSRDYRKVAELLCIVQCYEYRWPVMRLADLVWLGNCKWGSWIITIFSVTNMCITVECSTLK